MPEQDQSTSMALGYWPTIYAYYHQEFSQSSLLVQVVTCSGPVDADALGRAVSLVAARHPLLNCSLDIQSDKVTLVESAEPAGRFEIARAKVIDQEASARDLLEKGLDEADAELWRVVLVQLDDSSDQWLLAMLCNHAVADGLSLVTFFDQVLTTYASRADTAGDVMGIPELPETLAGVDIAPSTDAPDMVEWPVSECVAPDKCRVGLVDVPLAVRSVDRLLAACQRERVSFTNLLTVAVLRAQGLYGRAKVTTAVDIRRRVTPPISEEHFGCYAGVVEATVPAEDDIWEHARRSAVFQFRGKNRLIMPVPNGAILVHMMRARIDRALEAGEFAAGCSISDLGPVPIQSSYGEVSVESMLLANRQTAGLYSVFVSAYQFDGALHFNLSYADPLLSPAEVKELGRRIAAILQDCV